MAFVRSQATTVMKQVRARACGVCVCVFALTCARRLQVVSRYPYEERQGQHHEHNLKSESSIVSNEAVQLLQDKVNISGARILTFA